MSKRVAIALIRNNKDKVLMGARNDNSLFTVPGGHLEAGEDPHEGMLRELKEETGLDPKMMKLIGASFWNGLLIYLFDVTIDFDQKIDVSEDPDQECADWSFIDPISVKDKLHVPMERNLAIQHWSKTI